MFLLRNVKIDLKKLGQKHNTTQIFKLKIKNEIIKKKKRSLKFFGFMAST